VTAADDRAVDAARADSRFGFAPVGVIAKSHAVGDTSNAPAESAGSTFNAIDHRAEKTVAA